MNPWIPIIAKYGIEFAIQLAALINNKTEPTAQDFIALKDKYASMKAEDYLKLVPPVPGSP